MMCMKYGTEVKGDAMVYLVTSAVGYEECVTSSSLLLSSIGRIVFCHCTCVSLCVFFNIRMTLCMCVCVHGVIHLQLR